jgi:hypothetical protein
MEESRDPDSSKRPQQSACANASLAAEIERTRRMTTEERIKAALSMGDRFAWLDPAPRDQEG